MDRAPHERDVAPSNNNGHPMLSPIRTAPPPSAAPHMGPVSNSTRLPFFQDQASAHGWNNHHHLPSSVHTSSSSALAHAALDPASYTNQRPPPIIQTNLSHFAPTPDVDYDPSSGARFPTQLTPLDSSPLGHTSHPSASHIPNSGSSPVTATAKGSRGPGSRGPRSKPPVSIANNNTAGSGSASSSGGPTGQAGRNSQPKSTRKQFSACGSCQYRQVKCDLKDKVFQEGEKASCTACIDRGINCVSAYPQAQKPKAQRRGKRIINVEAMFGKKHGEEAGPGSPDGQQARSTSGEAHPSLTGPATATGYFAGGPSGNTNPHHYSDPPSCIPQLQPEFLDTPFYRSFHTQRPIIDPTEFKSRFSAIYQQRSDPRQRSSPSRSQPNAQPQPRRAGDEMDLLASVLVTWAASYGIDEYGREDADEELLNSSHTPGGSAGSATTATATSGLAGPSSANTAVDFSSPTSAVGHHFVDDFATGELVAAKQNGDRKKARRARVSTMVQEILEGVDKLALLRRPSWDGVRVLMLLMPLTEDCLSTVDRLAMYQSTISQIYTLCTHGSSLLTGSDRRKMVVARIFWYAYVHEGITSGLRGGKLIFDNDDLHVFEASHSKFRGAGIHGFALTAQPTLDRLSYKFSTAPIRLSTACRQINHALTGPKASLRRDVNGKELREGWEKLTQSWQEFDELREVLMNNDPSVFLQRPDMERFISGWQIFLFECLNVIREVLSQKLNEEPASPPQEAFISELDESGQPPSADARAKNLQNLHDLSESYCRDRFPRVMELVTHQLGSPTFFQWDASLVRDGTFYAGKWAATETNGSLDHVQTCITALRKMKWAFSLSEERIQTIQHAYNRRVYGGVGPSSPLTPFTGHPDSRAEALREQVFAGSHFTSVPSMPSESAGLVGQDPFEASWHAAATQPAYGHHTQGDMHAHSELPMWPQQQQLSQQQAVAVANGIPASKLNRLSPDELEAHGHAPPQQRTGVSPPSATSSQAEFPQQYRSSGYQGAVASEPYHDAHIPRTSYPGQQNQSWEPDNHSSAAGHMPAFVRIDSNAGHSYLPPANDPYQLHRGQQESAYHAGHGHGHQHGLIPHSHPHHGHGDSHSDEGSNDALYMAGNQGMNRTRYPPGFMEGGGYNA